MDYDSLIAIAEDLEYLAQWGSDITNAEIRRGTAILRRLLVGVSSFSVQ
jgi:propanediol dehydratase large subunit